ncbi:MAG: ABC transporter substrate-binding protein [Chloroflexota bacterium]
MRKLLSASVALITALPLAATLSTGLVRAQEANTEISGTVQIGMVANPQMVALQEMVEAGEFAKAYPNITLELTVLPENEIRQTITQDVTTQAGQFDVFTIGPFEVPMWAEQGWLLEVGEGAKANEAYNFADIFPAMTAGLSYEDGIYALPFYGESSMVFYRKDVAEAAGVTIPERPTWQEMADIAAKLDSDTVNGACLRGLPGWGEQGAPLGTVINAFGGSWFDMDWKSQLTSEKTAAAIKFYIELLQNYGPEGVEGNGFTENQTLFVQGKCGFWYDATSAAELLTDPALNPDGFDKVGFAYPPSAELPNGSWLWSWNFAAAANTDVPEAAMAFMEWATSTAYQDSLVAKEGWGRAPTGTRESTYSNPAYLERAGEFAPIVLGAIAEAKPNEPCAMPVPYTGGQFVRIPEFQQLGNDVTQEFAAALVGDQTIDEAIAKANDLANAAAVEGGYQS